MKKWWIFVMLIVWLSSVPLQAGLLEQAQEIISPQKQGSLDDSTIISGLKEALSIATDKAVASVSQLNGYFGNEMIKILMPEELANMSAVLSKVGFKDKVDEFILSMNRAAERSAPKAKQYFIEAVQDMTFKDAEKILQGGDTAATTYFKGKTYDKLYAAFKPDISASMNEVGVTRLYKEMMNKYANVPFANPQSVDLDHYVTQKSLDGLFYVIAQEEKKIRTDPAARGTELLQKVFGSK
ncbi:MAG: DUF4197 domain-containing protein [Deltaproteobacteria bacterium]|nr:DUF4197 domain-containing protein [Deltaproteobacteria bacterium]MBW2070704.1 DUF4197 domain-containing protein [Deltaproteobacteria bacterium]